MIGAIIGDIVGSRFEFKNQRSVEFELFHSECEFTDDTICTIAVAEWLLQDTKDLTTDQLAKIMRRWCKKYPSSYGVNFRKWIFNKNMGAYNSYGNGSAMRVSPVAWLYGNLSDTLITAKLSAEISHDHAEGIKGAQSIAEAIFMLRNGTEKDYTLEMICQTYDYKLPGTCDEIRATNWFDETCQITVPQAFQCFAESTGFEDCIRLAVSIGGDTDTIAAIAGSLAEACYGIPEDIESRAMAYLPQEMIDVINEFKKTCGYGK